MLGVILNETEVVHDFIFKREIPNHTSIHDVLKLSIKYLYIKNREKEVIYKIIMYCLKKYYKKDFIYTRWSNTIKRYIDFLYKGIRKYKIEPHMNDIEEIIITKNELGKIKELKDISLEKLAFIMLVYAKISNIQLDKDEFWINKSSNMIFKEAKVNIKGMEQNKVLHTLYKQEYIDFSKVVGKNNIKILYGDKEVIEGGIVVSDFDGVIYQYLIYKGEDWKKCERCNSKWFKPKSPTHTYCKSCAKEKWNEYNKTKQREYYNKNKQSV